MATAEAATPTPAAPEPGWAGGVFIALGSNVEPREAHIRSALAAVAERADCRIVSVSSLHETAPVGGPAGQGMFLNAVAELGTQLPPAELLAALLTIEAQHGRIRRERNGPRTLDLDLLLYGTRVLDSPALTLPHPRMWERSFVMEPLREICAAERLNSIRAATAAVGAQCRRVQ